MADQGGEALRDRLRRALPAAMKARDAPAVSALRSALAAIDNAQAIDNPEAIEAVETPPGADTPAFAGTVLGVGAAEAERRRLTTAQVQEILRAEVSDREAAAHAYEGAGQADRAERLRQEARVLDSYLERGEPTAR